jgi:FkbM family methyltransferase
MYPHPWVQLLRIYGQRFPIIRGKARLAKWAYTKLPKHTQVIRASIGNGIQLEFWPWLWADFCTYAIGSPEIYHLNYFKSRLTKRSTILDVGAYIGVYALNAGQIAVEGHVYAFEPDPRSARRLAQAIETNALKNVHLCQGAAGNWVGEVTFTLRDYPPQSSLQSNFIPPRPSGEEGEEVSVPIWTVDEYCKSRGIEQVDIIKIDVEGAELQVLRGAFATIAVSQPTLIIELHEIYSLQFGYTIQETIDYLHRLEYSLFHIAPGITKPRLIPFEYTANTGQPRPIVIAYPQNQMTTKK